MKVTVQVVTHSDDGQETIREVACVERADLTPTTLGLSLAESKTILQSLQEVVVEWQMQAYLGQQRHCPVCGTLRHSKGTHHTVFRTVFGALPVESPRLIHCSCQGHDTHSFSPLAALLPEHRGLCSNGTDMRCSTYPFICGVYEYAEFTSPNI